jgi:rhodanese-related sulfurtransferase
MSNQLPLEIDVNGVAALQAAGDDFLLLDVREPDEYAVASIAGSVLIPLSELQQRSGELESHRDRLIIVHCHHGGRSLRVTQALLAAGFEKVQNMAGGIDQWSQQVDSTVPRY